MEQIQDFQLDSMEYQSLSNSINCIVVKEEFIHSFNGINRCVSVDSVGQESNASSRSSNIESVVGDGNSILKEKKESRSVEKVKRKSAWYNAFYPTYKSKSEDFKRIFRDVPDDERLVVDYSCAIQKEILVHGRLYASQNFLCFYANIFGWETNVTIRWKDVSAITKEKTALVIPNAIQINTKNEKYFFTSFAARDKTYLMVFRIWQNALLDQPMYSQEMWQWIHQSYGDELGLTSDDDDYVPPGGEDDKLVAPISEDHFIEECTSTSELVITETMAVDEKNEDGIQPSLNHHNNVNSDSQLPTDMSDTTESDVEKTSKFEKATCSASHDGKELLNEIISMHIDQVFTLLFTSSKFFLDFHAFRRTTDLTQTAWTQNPTDNTKSRTVNLTAALNQSVGPKTCQVTETQVMLPCSKAGTLYAIDIESVNGGIPYADTFSVSIHYCLKRVSESQTSLLVCAQIKYKKTVWGLVKGFIEKNCWQGLEDYFKSLSKALYTESEEIIPTLKRKSRRRRLVRAIPRSDAEIVHPAISARSSVKVSSSGIFSSDLATLIVFGVLILLVVLNVMLYYKLWLLEDMPPYTLLDLHVLKDPPTSHDEWIKLLQKQETLHSLEMQRWQKVLKTSIQLLKQIEESLNELQHSIHPTYTSKIMSIIQNHKDAVDKVQEEL
ncbi:protein Aster-B-like isoform X3 [Photinus pyralis]|uniref:protein Aster-B-like isoform X3 n=1 Tax=Photinus pyralis TaxID=7054 RepID=UPI001266F191|nr:protein Aster-B-like isoform X3 [Photinus pyralis]